MALLPCPVCQRPFDSEAGLGTRCVECGWELISGFRAGEVTPELRDAFDAAVDAACARVDTLAVARALHAPDDPGPQVSDVDLGVLRRGRLPGAAESDCFERANRELASAQGVGMPRARALVRDTVMSPPGQLVFLEYGSTGITVHTAVTTEAGSLSITDPVQHLEWTDLLPGLSPDPVARRLRLAGGVPTIVTGTNVGTPADGLDRTTAVDNVRARLPNLARRAVIQVRRVVRWGLVDQIADELGTDLDAIDVFYRGSIAELVAELLAGLPLRLPIMLVVAAEEPGTRRLFPETVPLFAKGLEPPVDSTTTVEQSITVFAPPTVSGPLSLPVVFERESARLERLERHTGQDGVAAAAPELLDGRFWPDWLELTTVKIDAAPNEAIQVTVRLHAGPRVEFVDPRCAQADRTTLADLVASLPTELARVVRVDLVLAVDLCGKDEAVVRARFDLAQRVIAEAAGRTAGGLAVAVVGYGEHSFRFPPRPPSQFIRLHEFRSPTEASAIIAAWEPDPEWAYHYAAPVEEALQAVNRLTGWRASAQRAVLLLCERPPCEPIGGGRIHMCPHRVNWKTELARLTELSTRVVAVVDPPTWAGDGPIVAATGVGSGIDAIAAERAESIWGTISAGVLLRPATATAHTIVDRLGLAGTTARRFPLALRQRASLPIEEEST